jgi:hypothetical protein
MLKAFGIVVLVLSLITIGIWSQTDRIRTMLDPDYIYVELHGRLQHEQVAIYWKTEGQRDSTLIYEAGNQLVKSFPERGYNIFTITYNAQFVGAIAQFKTGKYHAHSYHFILDEQAEDILLTDVVISGIDGHR